ncbi:MAG TPA: hypothetical protein ENF75_06180, partial [Acidilobales archaeon]|nr:MAG: calcium-gated potassium channel protein [Thermoprotei archaeon]HDD26658.1 hypothetical protein [Acidilobales archaeon]
MVIFVVYNLLRRALHTLWQRKFLFVLFLFGIVTLINGLLFYWIEHVVNGRGDIDLFTSFYWSVITMATIGYGDVVPESWAGRVLALETAVMGIATFTLLISVIAEEFLSRSLKKSMGLGRLKGVNILVIGDTEVCEEVINELKINMRNARIAWVLSKQPQKPLDVEFVVGDPADEDTLIRGGVSKASKAIICLSDDSKAVHTILMLKRLNRGIEVIAMARTAKSAELMREAGASLVISMKLLGRTLASAVFEPAVVEFLNEATTAKGVLDIVELTVSKKYDGSPLSTLMRSYGEEGVRYVPVALIRGTQLLPTPALDTRLKEGDRVVLIKGVIKR